MARSMKPLAIATAGLLAVGACAQQNRSDAMASADNMTGIELQALLSEGRTLKLGGPGEDYVGEVTLEPDGRGDGQVSFTDGRVMEISGTWTIEGDRFCRKWSFNDYQRVCETWRKLDGNKAEVIVDGERIGLNSW